MKNILKLLAICLILSSCTKDEFEDISNPAFLEVSSDLNYDGNVYTFEYPENAPNSYFKINFNSLPTQRVYWDSPDEFWTIMWEGSNDTIWTPVVNFSTYSDDDGTGHQMVYVNQTLINDTLNIVGMTYCETGKTITKEILVKIISYE